VSSDHIQFLGSLAGPDPNFLNLFQKTMVPNGSFRIGATINQNLPKKGKKQPNQVKKT